MIPKEIRGWAALEKGGKLSPYTAPLRELGDNEVLIKVESCGVCHSDIHLIDNDWFVSTYPLIPGHEIIGRVVAQGKAVSFSENAVVGVGWQRCSCLQCDDCVSANEHLCPKKGATCVAHHGGYADYHVTDARFAFEMPANMTDPKYAPLLCGGTTVFSPLKDQIAQRRARTARVGVVALGGLGHLAVKFAKAMGFEVTVFSSSASKELEAQKLGAHAFINSKNPEAIEAVGRKFDLVLVTAAADMPWTAYLHTLRSDGNLCFVGVPPTPLSVPVYELLDLRLKVSASTTGSRPTIREMLEFASVHELGAEIETFPMNDVNAALDKVRNNTVRHRAVLVNS